MGESEDLGFKAGITLYPFCDFNTFNSKTVNVFFFLYASSLSHAEAVRINKSIQMAFLERIAVQYKHALERR